MGEIAAEIFELAVVSVVTAPAQFLSRNAKARGSTSLRRSRSNRGIVCAPGESRGGEDIHEAMHHRCRAFGA